MPRATQVSYSVGQPITILLHDPRTFPPLADLPVTRVAKRKDQGMNLQCVLKDVDLPMRTFRTNLYEF